MFLLVKCFLKLIVKLCIYVFFCNISTVAVYETLACIMRRFLVCINSLKNINTRESRQHKNLGITCRFTPISLQLQSSSKDRPWH